MQKRREYATLNISRGPHNPMCWKIYPMGENPLPQKEGSMAQQARIGSTPGSLKAIKTKLKKGSGAGLIKWVPKDKPLVVRFLQEPEEFVMYQDCWDGKLRRSFPFVEGMEEGKDFDRASTVFLANALDIDTDKVIPLQLKQSIMNTLIIRFEKIGTLMDRDYEISRYGAGLDTTYDVMSEAKQPRNLRKYELLDLEDILRQSLEAAFPTESGAEDDRPQRRTSSSSGTSTRTAPRRVRRSPTTGRVAPDEDDEESEDDDEGPTTKEMKEMDWKELNEYAVSIGVKLHTGKRSALIEAIEEKRETW